MHVIDIIVIAEDAPGINIDLIPLFLRINFHLKSSKVNFARTSFLTWSKFYDSIILTGPVYCHLPVGSERGGYDEVKDLLVLLIRNVVFHQLAIADEYKSSVSCTHYPVFAGFTWKGCNATVDTIKINFNLDFFFC